MGTDKQVLLSDIRACGVLFLDLDGGDFPSQFPYFQLQTLILFQLALQKEKCRPRLFLDTVRRQLVEVGNFIAGTFEVVHLDKTALNQRLDQVIDLAQAHAEARGKLPLGQGRIVFDGLEDFQDVFIFLRC